jgi:response regulator RpfG family c-di-GMP phosphodiesterase
VTTEPPPAPVERAGYSLVVGTESPDRDWIMASLQWAQMEAYACAQEALAHYEDLQPPAITILDHHGAPAEVLASQKALLSHPGMIGVPLLVLSYNADIDSFSNAIAGGASAYLVKPLDAEELVSVVRKLSGWVGTSDRTEKRRRLRRALLLHVDVDLRARKVRVPGQIVDASGGGCRIELQEPLEVGEMVRLVLHSHQGSTHVALGAEVRWHRQSPDGPHVAGLRFTGTTSLYAGQLLGVAAREQAST